jgi:hypothetical protein
VSESPDTATAALTGGCLCGAVRFEIDEPLLDANYCHCTRCQRRTGTGASANGRPVPGSVRIVAGEERIRGWLPPGTGWEKCFCADCGSHLFSRDRDDHAQMGVRLGAIDGDPGVRPSKHQFVTYAAVWEPVPDDGLPRHPESSRTA